MIVKQAHTDAVLRKMQESTSTSSRFFEEQKEQIVLLAAKMASAFEKGSSLFTIGNGGSACDAEHVSVEFMHPIFEKRKPLPCYALTTQGALISAVANDIDFSATFSLQLKQLAKQDDMLLAISTSGMSSNLVRACEAARDLGLTTIAFTGKDGGRLAKLVDWSFNVPSYSIHRIQESHVMLLHILWDVIHLELGEDDVI